MIDLGSILRYATPIALPALGESIGEKAGVINVGLEGLMLGSAFAATMTTLQTGNPWLGLAAGAVVGIGIALLLGLFAITLGQDQIVVGTGINLLSLGVCGTVYERVFGKSGKLLSFAQLPSLKAGGLLGNLDLALPLLVVTIAFSLWLLNRSSLGLKLRAAGEYPNAVVASGFSVQRIRYIGLGLMGLIAGIGGAYFAVGVTGSFSPGYIAGRGFVAIAMVTFGRWKPMWILLGSLLIGYAERLQLDLQASGIKVPLQILLALPYILTLAVLVILGKGVRAPAALGKAYTER